MSASGGVRGNHRDIRKGAVGQGAAKERKEAADLAARSDGSNGSLARPDEQRVQTR
jgi:hypothetical protein